MAFNHASSGFSAAQLLDPRSMKQKMPIGTSSSSSCHPDPLSTLDRSSSEPPQSSSRAGQSPRSESSSPPTSLDDAYIIEGTKQPASTTLDSGRQLLDPKSFLNGGKSTQKGNKKPQPAALSPGPFEAQVINGNGRCMEHSEAAAQAEKGLSSLIENLHGVKDRSERPAKRQKVEQEQVPKKKAQDITIRGGGNLGEYVKEKRKEGAQEAMANGFVDLTDLNDDEDLVVVSENLVVPEVCYGRLQSTKVHAHNIPSPPSKGITQGLQWPSIKVTLKRFPSKDHIIRVLDPTGRDFGTIDTRTAVGLAPLLDRQEYKVRTQGRLNPRPRGPYEYPGLDVSQYYEVTVNLYGPLDKADNVGRWLSQRQLWLRTPFLMDNGIEYHNPQQPDGAAMAPKLASTRYPAINGYNSRTVEEVRKDVTSVFDSLEQSRNLPEAEADPRVMSELMSHQKQGLYFLQNRESPRTFSEKDEENNSLWRKKHAASGKVSYYNIITGHEQQHKPYEVLGGILADMMGLGKTLSILALIAGSLELAAQFGDEAPPEHDELTLIRNVKTTLLIAPLSTMNNWENQIEEHLVANSLTYYVYHGQNRTTDVNELAKYDIVITTYSIVASEFFGRVSKNKTSPLFSIHFFRIVLDEAHMIREPSTRQNNATCALSASRRWAVTGTPVQNRLDDLGSLIKFLRLQPFCDKGGFTQHILMPFKTGDTEVIPKLRILVDSITLRRLKDTISLPDRHDHIVRLEFDEDERKLYEWFAKDSRNKLNIIANSKLKGLGGKSYSHVLRAILRLRLICAHGKELLNDEDLKVTEGLSKDNAIDIESEGSAPVLGPRQAYEMLMLARESDTDTCVSCSKTVMPRDNEDDTDVIGTMLPCYQIVCRDCSEGVQAALVQRSVDSQFRCPYCEGLVPTSFFELTKTGMEAADEQRLAVSKNPRHAKVLGRYNGPHTKVKALIDGLLQSQKESEPLIAKGELPIKSVVFSGWTSFLDLIQIAVEDHNINFVRLDGKTSRKDRNAALTAFREDPKICVILISINAGGLGLNLTTGSKVYVMEPQFNPAAEAQAVDRVHRLGQTREVFIQRFIMNNSFEEKMLELQRKKQRLAELSLSKGKLDKAEAAKQKLDEIKSLFK